MSPPGNVNPVGGSGKKQGRDSWCTPKWLAKLIGPVKLDPCSNERSHIKALIRCILAWGSDGLDEYGRTAGAFWMGYLKPFFTPSANASTDIAKEDWDVFLNPGYNRGEVIKWIRHYGHTRFIFLLRWSPDTKWFKELLPKCDYLWFPPTRVNFEPPPGVASSSNPYPHALYLRKPSEALLARLRGAGYLVRVDEELLRSYLGPHEGTTVTKVGAAARGRNIRREEAVRAGAGGDRVSRAAEGGRGAGTRAPAEVIYEPGCRNCGAADWACQGTCLG